MSPLAAKIYKQLRKRLTQGKPSITYGEIAAAAELHVRARELYVALGEITNACRHAELPCISAIVWRTSPRQPAAGYFKVAHPRAHTDEARLSAWQREHARVISEAARFPPRL
jgi:hypothetical protein